MTILTEENYEELLSVIRPYLGITWRDYDLDTVLKAHIQEGLTRLESIYGHDLDVTAEDDAENIPTQADILARSVLRTYVFYAREKALDDWEKNYRDALLTLYNLGRVKSKQEEEEESEDAESE